MNSQCKHNTTNSKVTAHLDFRSAWDRNDVVALGEQPSDGNLTASRAVLRADFLQGLDEIKDLREVLLRVPEVEINKI